MIFKIIAFIPAALMAILVIRAVFLYESLPPEKASANLKTHPRIKLDNDILDRFKAALNIPTISYKIGHYDYEQLLNLISVIEKSFPEIHKATFIKRERVANYTLLYTVEGTDESLRPYLLTSHLDVVPAVNESWSSNPFEAVIKEDNFIYARGTIDAKHLLMSMLEAFELMLKQGFRPKRSFYFVFGHDEEVGGVEGAKEVGKILYKRIQDAKWDKLEFVLDEGNVVSKTRFPGINADIGLIGVVEKGYMTVKVHAIGSVGHGSMPSSQTAITKLSSAIGKFHSHVLPSFMGRGVERDMLEIFASYSDWPYKLIYSNFWFFCPLLDHIFSSDKSTNSLIRTSTAVTLVEGGTKENVLPDSASAYINHRIHPSQSIQEVLEFDRKIINDPTISVEIINIAREPTPIAVYCDDCYGYQLIKHTTLQLYPGTVIVPSTFLAASDSRWYVNLTDSIYKFSPIAVHLEETKRFHGHDERLSLENYENLINFYYHLIHNSDAAKVNFKPRHRTEL